ncbi:MAG TPA: hypothetical protein VGD84_00655, partial [Pseudonocardiaceae bacterium]
QEFAGTALWLNGSQGDPVGRPAAAELATYRQATALMTTARADADTLLSLNEAAARQADQSAIGDTVAARVWVVLLGVLLAAALVLAQLHLRRAWRRRMNPALIVATVLAIATTITATVLLSQESTHLATAEHSGFEPVASLSQARAGSRESAADESRYLVDQANAANYQQAFQNRSQQVLNLPGADLTHYDAMLRAARNAYAADNTTVPFGGYLGEGLRNVGSTDEQLLVQRVIARFQGYEVADRMLRATVATGDVRDAAYFDTTTALGYSSYNLNRYDASLGALIEEKQQVFSNAAHAGEVDLAGWTWPIPAGIGLLLLVALTVGVRPRLTEYRR